MPAAVYPETIEGPAWRAFNSAAQRTQTCRHSMQKSARN